MKGMEAILALAYSLEIMKIVVRIIGLADATVSQ